MKLLSAYHLGSLRLPNRTVMAPMTRARAIDGDDVPHPQASLYYSQRAGAGLIITEGSQISRRGAGYIRTPGIYSPKQIEAWSDVCRSVHSAGGRIFLQLWHVGRVSHPDVIDGEMPVAPSAIAAEGEAFTRAGPKKLPVPRALETHELSGIVTEFENAAWNAKAAGFDGVELHGANGYLLDQFLRDGSNHRQDAYGGSVENRARLPLEITEAVIGVWGAERVGYRIAPHFSAYSMSDSNPANTFSYLAAALSALRIGYLHVVEAVAGPAAPPPEAQRLTPVLRAKFSGTLMVNGGYDAVTAERVCLEGRADLISFGVPFLANPDLPARFAVSADLNTPDASTFYQGEARGYIDYPSLPA